MTLEVVEEGIKSRLGSETFADLGVEPTLVQMLKVAEDAAIAAGKFLLSKQGHVQIIQKKALRDSLLDVDLQAEKIILDTLHAHFPNHDILSEEEGRESQDSEYQWVVDPLDGSFNFQHDSPIFGISISLLVKSVPTLAIIYLPRTQEMFTAILGYGSLYNDQAIHVSCNANLDDAIVHVGDFSKKGSLCENEEQLEDIAHLANAVGRVRMIGTAATDLAYVACGRADALVVHKHNALPWDVLAGQLLIHEAGGKITSFPSNKEQRLLICSNERIHDALLSVLRKELVGSA